MKRLRRCLPLFALLLMLAGSITSCRDAGVRDALVRAEALMESDPHAARAVLDSLDLQSSILTFGRACSRSAESEPAPFCSRSIAAFNLPSKDVALYALLRTQADYKCDVPLTSDSLPLIATNYYGTKRKTQRAALAQHYLGCTYLDMHRDLDAIEAQLRATTLFPDTTDKYFAHSLLHLGILYSKHYMIDNAQVALGRYRQTEVCNSDSVNIGYADYYMGVNAIFYDNDNLTDSLFQCVLNNSKTTDYIRFTTFFQLAKLRFYHQHDIEGAIAYIEKTGGYFGEENGALQMLKADILAQQQQPKLAYDFYKNAIRNSSDIYIQCSSYEGLASMAPLLNKPDSTRFFIDQYKSLLDSIYTMNKQRDITEIKEKHIVEIHDQQMKARHTRFLLLGGLFFAVAFSAFAITLLLNDRKRKNERLRFEQELRDIKQRHINQSIKEEEPEMEVEVSSVSESESDVLETQTNTSVPPRLSIQQERVTLYRKQYKDSEWARYFREHQLEIRSKDYITPKDSVRFMAYLHELFADIFLDMVNDNQELTHQDLEYSAMVMLGFNTVQMSYCARVSSHSLHNRRYRMREKLTSEWYALIFGNPK